MIKDALEFIFGQAESRLHPVPHVRLLGGRKQMVTIHGVSTEETIPPVRLRRKADSLSSVAALVEEFGGEKPTIYVNSTGLAVVLDNDDREERIWMEFESSKQALALSRLAEGVAQRTLIRTLRTDLAGCVQHEGIVALMRQVEFGVDVGNRSAIQHQSESMGRSVDRVVRANAGDIPEELRVVLPLFSIPSDVNTTIDVTCAVDIDMDQQKISLMPTGDSMLREQIRIVNDIARNIEKSLPEAIVVLGEVS